MGEIVRINAGNKARGFEGVGKLRTPLSGGGTCLWVPSHAVRLGTKRVTENGTYSAADEQLYGYSSVEVNVNAEVDQLTGKGQDGNDYSVTKDGSGGLVETKVPSEIRVTKLPNTLTYEVGSALSFDGIEVTAYYGDGSVYGIISTTDLVFPITQAPMEPSGDPEYDMESDLDTGVVSQPIPASKKIQLKAEDGRTAEYKISGSGKLVGFKTNVAKTAYIIFASSNSGDITGTVKEATYNNKTVYYSTMVYIFMAGVIETITPDAGSYNGTDTTTDNRTAWTLIYGDLVGQSGGYQVPVQWSRPGDGLTLETSYGITVTAITGGGGQAGDNGTGRND